MPGQAKQLLREILNISLKSSAYICTGSEVTFPDLVMNRVKVKLIDIDRKTGKLKLSRKVLLPKPEKNYKGN